jgi:hypothetical protein
MGLKILEDSMSPQGDEHSHQNRFRETERKQWQIVSAMGWDKGIRESCLEEMKSEEDGDKVWRWVGRTFQAKGPVSAEPWRYETAVWLEDLISGARGGADEELESRPGPK